MIIKAESITKRFKDKEVLKGIDFTVDSGEIHAILGKNGAGKSTFIKLALGLIFPTTGRLFVYDEKPGLKNEKIGYLSEDITLYPHLSARDNLKVAAYLANRKISSSEVSTILERVSLSDTGNKPSKAFSLGMKRRLQLAMSTMVKSFDFLILDEPTNGLDINGLMWLKGYLKELQKKGVSILLASHAILDLQDCITDYAIFHNGIIAKKGRWCAEQKKIQGVKITVNSAEINHTLDVLKAVGSVAERIEDGGILLHTDMTYKEVCGFLYKNNILPEGVEVLKGSLESLFLDATKEMTT